MRSLFGRMSHHASSFMVAASSNSAHEIGEKGAGHPELN